MKTRFVSGFCLDKIILFSQDSSRLNPDKYLEIIWARALQDDAVLVSAVLGTAVDLILACRVTIKIGYDWLWVVISWNNGISPWVIWVNIDVWIIFQLALPKTCCIDFVKLPWRCQIRVELLSALKLNRQLLVFFALVLTNKRWFVNVNL